MHLTGFNCLVATKDAMLAQMGAAFLEIDQANLQEENECGPCLLFTATTQVCGEFERPAHENDRRTALAVGLYAADVRAVLGSMSALDFETHLSNLGAKLNESKTEDSEKIIICNHHGSYEAARMKRMNSNTVSISGLRMLMTCGSAIKGSSLALPNRALPRLASPCLALPCLALPCPAVPCPALPCFALLCFALPCVALRCLALPCVALPWLGFNDILTYVHAH
jgi:hypothetical protein